MNFLSFGEILFDVFPDRQVIGGAPLNASAHLAKLGLEGGIISAVGNDELGRAALKAVRDFNIDTKYIGISGFETAKATITLVDKNADYTFNDPSAFDDIRITNELPSSTDLLYFGTLASRKEVSRKTLEQVIRTVKAREIFFDVNMRKNFYTKELLEWGIANSTILKMNEDEVPITAKELGLSKEEVIFTKELFEKYPNLKLILITKGKHGTWLYSKDEVLHQGCSDVKVVDTVGAGDSFSAGFLYTYLLTGKKEKALKIGSLLADYVVTQKGANPSYSDELKNTIEAEIKK